LGIRRPSGSAETPLEDAEIDHVHIAVAVEVGLGAVGGMGHARSRKTRLERYEIIEVLFPNALTPPAPCARSLPKRLTAVEGHDD